MRKSYTMTMTMTMTMARTVARTLSAGAWIRGPAARIPVAGALLACWLVCFQGETARADPAGADPAGAAPLPVVASFSILADMVRRVGGDHVTVTSIVEPGADTHVYRPSPADARAIREAKLLVVNGLGFEGWLDRLTGAAGFDGVPVTATTGIDPLVATEGHHSHGDDAHGDDAHGDDAHGDDAHGDDAHGDDAHGDDAHGDDAHGHHSHGDDAHENGGHENGGHTGSGGFDPHAWQSLTLAQTYVRNIATALMAADPANAAAYRANRDAYLAEMVALDREIRDMLAPIPAERRIVATAHDAFQYFGRDYGLTFLALRGISTETAASARDMAQLITHLRTIQAPAVFPEANANPKLLQQIAAETGATIGGTLYPGSLTGPDGPAPDYLALMRHNARALAAALSPRAAGSQ